MRLQILYSDKDNLKLLIGRIGEMVEPLPVPIRPAALSRLDRSENALVWLDHSRPDPVMALAEAFREAPLTGPRRIFAVRPGNRHDVVQAFGLGANRLVRTDAGRQNLVAALFGTNPPAAPPAGWAGLPKGMRQCLESMLAMISHVLDRDRGEAPSPRYIEVVSREIIASVAEQGIARWIDAIRQHHDATFQHCMLVLALSVAFSQKLGFRPADQSLIAAAATLHDVGKARIPVAILNKAGPLTGAEFEVMKRHPAEGAVMLGTTEDVDPLVRDVVLHHHERLDGSGYPFGLRGSRVSDPVRLIAICDVFAALIETRSYKTAYATEHAMAIMRDMGAAMDQALLSAFEPVACAWQRSSRGRGGAALSALGT